MKIGELANKNLEARTSTVEAARATQLGTLTTMHKPTFIPLIASLITIAACQLDPQNIGTPDSASEPSTSTGTTASPTETSPGTAGETDTSTAGETETGEPLDPVCGLPPDSQDGPSWPDNYVWFPAWGGMLNEQCVLEATEVTDIGLKLILDCPIREQEIGQDTYEFTITGGPLPTLPPIGSTIDASGEFGGIDISNDSEMLVLRSEGKLVYAAVRALHIDPEFAAEAYTPLALARIDLCLLKSFAEEDTALPPQGDGFVCERIARAQLRVSTAGSDDLLLLDDAAGMIAAGQTTYAVDVRRAWQVENCEPDHPQGVLDMVAFAIAAQ